MTKCVKFAGAKSKKGVGQRTAKLVRDEQIQGTVGGRGGVGGQRVYQAGGAGNRGGRMFLVVAEARTWSLRISDCCPVCVWISERCDKWCEANSAQYPAPSQTYGHPPIFQPFPTNPTTHPPSVTLHPPTRPPQHNDAVLYLPVLQPPSKPPPLNFQPSPTDPSPKKPYQTLLIPK